MAPYSGIRRILVPADIVAVPRRSPVRIRKRTPWHPQPDGSVTTERSGGREWFSDRLFVESQSGHDRHAYGASIGGHCVAAGILVLAIVMQPVPALRVGDGSGPMVMPAMLVVLPTATATAGQAREESAAPRKTRPLAAASEAPPQNASTPTPIDAPPDIQPEAISDAGSSGVPDGLDGVAGGGAGGGGVAGGGVAGGADAAGPFRVGTAGVRPPRKIKDVKPEYPAGVLNDETRGTVVIEATIGVDGKVRDARIVHSVPALDRAALDAVRQWEYLPSIVDGRPAAIVMTVIVNFAIQ